MNKNSSTSFPLNYLILLCVNIVISVSGLSCSDATVVPAVPYFATVSILESGSVALQPSENAYFYRSGALRDIDGDGNKDAVVTIATYPQNEPQPIIILDGADGVINRVPELFPGGDIKLRHCHQIHFIDLNSDSREDILFSEAGLDYPPWTGGNIGIAFRNEDNTFTDVSGSVPEEAKNLRCYSLAVGNFRADGFPRVILPSQIDPDKTVLLYWNGTAFDFEAAWVPHSIWYWDLSSSSFMDMRDFDSDGFPDLYVSGTWTTPNHRILYGSGAFPDPALLTELPEGPFGHTPYADYESTVEDSVVGADVNQTAIADFDGDGRLDLFSISERVEVFKPGVEPDPGEGGAAVNSGNVYTDVAFQVILNSGSRVFSDITNLSGNSILGRRYYVALLVEDINSDGHPDVIAHYWSKVPGEPKWGTTFFLNQGDASFEILEAKSILPEVVKTSVNYSRNGIGACFPVRIDSTGFESLFITPDDTIAADPKLQVTRVYVEFK